VHVVDVVLDVQERRIQRAQAVHVHLPFRTPGFPSRGHLNAFRDRVGPKREIGVVN
jgi:hypothetical protein